MFMKCLPLLFILSFVEAQYPYYRGASTCSYPRLDHGRVRVRQRSKLVKFMCNYGYELVGNRYATCRNGQWDEPAPVCVTGGCDPVPGIKGGLQMLSHHGAWLVVFCFPGHTLVGSPVIYCDGARWNATAPTCVDSSNEPMESCDFESEDLCGWKQDELHDFDWRRLNKRTPSSFLFTGPSYDHTLGAAGEGHFMYIESTTQKINDTARLISPIYDASVVRDGCFQFYYHMFGKDIGGLRVYQKPESFPMASLLNLNGSEKQKYILFEQWGNQGNQWYSYVHDLLDFSDSFQIVIEGIRGQSSASDVAIDDVSILHGSNCTLAKDTASTPATIVVTTSCSNRCDLTAATAVDEWGARPSVCGCTAECIIYQDCCSDFIELCVYGSNATNEDIASSTTMDPPQTQKLVATTNSTSTTSTTTPRTTTTTSTSTTTTTTSTSTTTTTRPTTSTTTSTTTTTPKPTTTRRTTRTTTPKPTTTRPTTSTTTTTTTKPTTKPSTKITVTTTTRPPTTPKIQITTKKLTTMITNLNTTKATSYTPSTATIKRTSPDKQQKEEHKTMEIKKIVPATKEKNSNALRTSLITIAVLASCCVVAFFAISMRTSRGRMTFARLRGRTTRDPEVRYLSADVDD